MSAMNVTRVKLPGIRRALAQQPWAIQLERLESMIERLEMAAASHGGALEFAGSVDERRQRAATAQKGKVQGAIAVLPLHGLIEQRYSWLMDYFGGTSTELFGDAFEACVNDPQVGAIVIDVDSPGGTVAGTPELAKRIYAARGQKPIIAVVNSLMASAAFWIGSAADEIVATPSAEGVGAIGVYALHVDWSAALEQMGIKATIIRAPEHKAEGNPYEPLTDDAQVFIQAQIDEMYGMFAAAVSKQRGVNAKDVKENYGGGRCLTAKQALGAGMVDRIATLDEVIAKLGGGTTASVARARADGSGHPTVVAAEPEDTNNEVTDPPASEAAESESEIASHSSSTGPIGQGEPMPETATAPVGAGTAAQASAESILANERTRVASITALCAQEHVPQLAAELIASGATVDAAASRILTARREQLAGSPQISVGADREADRAFTSFGEQLRSVITAKRTGMIDRRLTRVNRKAIEVDTHGAQFMAGVSGMNESVGSEGGFFIEPQLLPGIIDPVYNDDPILSRVTRIPIGSQSSGVKYNVVDETARTTGNRWGGIQMAWGAEADSLTASKAKLRQVMHDLKKLTGAAYLTDELMQDAPAAEALLSRAFQAEIQFMLAAAIYAGTGAGQPLGIKTSAAFISVAIEGGQTIANSAASLALNTSKMMSRVPASLWPDIIWLYNQELLPYLQVATLGGTSVGAFTAAGGATNRPFDTIWGRAAFASELCEAVGTPGDIQCLVPSQYHVAEKGGPQAATSLHVRFLNDETTLRITYRVDGQPVWRQSVTPYKGANARSPFVGLAVRA